MQKWYQQVTNIVSKRYPKSEGTQGAAQARSPPSSDSSPLVKPLRGAPGRHRTPRQSQSFPEQQTSVLSQQQTSVLSQQQTSVLSQQKTSILSQQMTSNPRLRRPR